MTDPCTAAGAGTAPEKETAVGWGTAPPPGTVRIPFPTVDEVSRHCLSDDEPESVHIEVHLPGRLDPVRLRAAFQHALLTHPRVLAREVPGRGHRRSFAWELSGRPDSDPVSFAGPGPDALARARARALTECPPLTLVPPMRLEVVQVEEGGTVLLLTLHHTALDAPSGLRVLATTAERYGGTAALPVPGRVRPEPSGPAPSGTGATGRTVRARPVRVAPDSRPGFVRARAVGNDMVQADLPVPRRAAGDGSLPPWTVNDQLLVATSLMVGRWNLSQGRPAGPVRLTMPVDDRPRGTDMPMGNGTRLVEVAMTSEDPRDTELLLGDRPDPEAVTRLLRTTARRTGALKSADGTPMGAGASLLTAPLLPVGVRGVLTRGARRAAASWTSTALVTNIGRVPYALDFGDAGRATALWFSAPARMPRGLSVAAASTGGRLHVTLRWSRALLGDAAGAELAVLFAESLSATSFPQDDTPCPDATPTETRSTGQPQEAVMTISATDPAATGSERAGSTAPGSEGADKSPEKKATSPSPPAPGLRDFYENPTVPVASGEARTLRQARMLADALGPVGPGRPAATVLDVGCGDGSAGAIAARVLGGHRIVGIDWSQDALRRAAPRLSQVVRGELTGSGLPFASDSADAVLFSEVVEHLVDPDSALDELRRVLRPGGHLMLSTPNLGAWYNRALLLAGVQPVFSEVSLRRIHGRPGSEVVGHLRLYTARALREFVAASGFEVVKFAGAPFHGVPRPLRPLDRLACGVPSLASILLVHARKV